MIFVLVKLAQRNFLIFLYSEQLYASIEACFDGNLIITDNSPSFPSTIWPSKSFAKKEPPSNSIKGLNSSTCSVKVGFLTL